MCRLIPGIYIKYWMGGVEKYFLKFNDIRKFQKLELSTRGRGLRTPWPDPPPPTPVKIRTCMYPQWITFSCALGRRIYFADDVLSCFFIILCHEEWFFFSIFRLSTFTVICSALWILLLNVFFLILIFWQCETGKNTRRNVTSLF